MSTAKTGVAGIASFFLAIVVLVLFRWTPMTGRGFLLYAALLLAAILLAVGLAHNTEEDETQT
jgi:uncharacterized membrane protein